MHDMSNTRKEIAARLGFAAKEVFADKRTTAGALRKALKAKGITSAADLEWHGISAKDPDSTPYWLYEDGSMEKIKASRPGAKASFGRFDTELKFLDFQIMQQPDLAQKNVIALAAKMGANPNITKDEMDGLMRAAKWLKMESQVKKAYEDSRSAGEMSRSGAKTRMTREQTEEQKAGLKIMSAADPAVGAKIAKLIKEGKPQDQAVAIALDMKRRGEI